MTDQHVSPSTLDPKPLITDHQFILNLAGYEGPLDALLNLAKTHKIDLTTISILDLVNQFLLFVEKAKSIKIELAAEYLVMAAWLVYLKSRLLLPDEQKDEEEFTPDQLAEALAFQLKRLEAIQKVSQQLMERPQLGSHFFVSKLIIEGPKKRKRYIYKNNLYDLLKAYCVHIERQNDHPSLEIEPLTLYSMEEAFDYLKKMIPIQTGWQALTKFLPSIKLLNDLHGRSIWASTFVASLEMARSGQIHIRQDQVFGPIYIKAYEDEK
ncbi:MAG: segregation/condensation protein A [Alphaproteobacteria bacterium]|nr:segregation/condensation protein A [Alphaproteobacteria bacterium]